MTISTNKKGKIFRPFTIVSQKKYNFLFGSQIFLLFLVLFGCVLALHKVIAGFNRNLGERTDGMFVVGNVGLLVAGLFEIFFVLYSLKRGHLKIEDRIIFPLSAKEKLIKENKEIDESGTPTYTIFSSSLFNLLLARKIFGIVVVIVVSGLGIYLTQSLGPKYYPNGFWLIRGFDIAFIVTVCSSFFIDVLSELSKVFKNGYVKSGYFKKDFAHVYPSGSKIKNQSTTKNTNLLIQN